MQNSIVNFARRCVLVLAGFAVVTLYGCGSGSASFSLFPIAPFDDSNFVRQLNPGDPMMFSASYLDGELHPTQPRTVTAEWLGATGNTIVVNPTTITTSGSITGSVNTTGMPAGDYEILLSVTLQLPGFTPVVKQAHFKFRIKSGATGGGTGTAFSVTITPNSYTFTSLEDIHVFSYTITPQTGFTGGTLPLTLTGPALADFRIVQNVPVSITLGAAGTPAVTGTFSLAPKRAGTATSLMQLFAGTSPDSVSGSLNVTLPP